MRTLMLMLAVALLAVSVSCAKNEDKTPSASTTAAATPAASTNCQDRTLPTPTPLQTVPQTKPTVVIPDGPPPCKLVIEDIHVGDGATATSGSTVTAQYVGVSWSTRKQFDASWDPGHGGPATFPLAQVVPGWQQGIPGMKVGGRRELIIPPALGYGAAGRPPVIAPNETLVFIIDLIKVE